MNPNLIKIQQAVWKAVPEVLELKYGCKILETRKRCTIDWIILESHEKTKFTIWNPTTGTETISITEPFEILGQEITLANVLRTIKKKVTAKKWFEAVDHLVGRAQWNLELSLSSQSEETLQFLAEII